MLKDDRVPRGKRRNSSPHYLPSWEIPGHHKQHNTQRVEPYIALRGLRLNILWLEESLHVLNGVINQPNTLVHLSFRLADGFTHLHTHQLGELTLLCEHPSFDLSQRIHPRICAPSPIPLGLP